MAEPLLRTPDSPNFDTYPAPTPSAQRALPQGNPGDDRLNDAAEQIGSSVGRAIRNVRQLPEQLGELKDRFTVIRGRGKRAAGEKAQEVKEAAAERVQRTRRRIDMLVNEYPVQVILAAAGAAFLLGVSLRVWRSNRG
jgi:ElaB/YqjD/DUF883 family membrane-anchored ribosome-binding protein